MDGETALARLKEVLDQQSVRRMVVPVREIDDLDVQTWSAAIKAQLHDRESSFQRMEQVRRQMAIAKPWKKAIAELTAQL